MRACSAAAALAAAALPYSDEQRRYNAQLNIEDSDHFSSAEDKKAK